MLDVFVSYARSSLTQARAVADALRAAGYQVWIDEELPAHRAYADVIEERLLEAGAVVVIWSDQAVNSQWVRAEADVAREAGKLVQVSIDGVVPRLPFNQIQCSDLRGWSGAPDAPGWRKVLASIAELVGDPVTPTGGSDSTDTSLRENSICVLPFTNISGDEEQEYFSDGITEDIITDLSKVAALFVIAHNTAFTFKGRSIDVVTVARQLRVSHVLEGSVRKAGGRVRITAQLIDGASGGHVWAERYDRDLNDIFALQDEISAAIVGALKLKLLPQEKLTIELSRTSSLEAYDLYLRGTRPTFAPEEMRAQIALLETATRLAPDYADAWGALAHTRSNWLFSRPYPERRATANIAATEAERALTLDPHNAAAMWAQLNLLPPFGRFGAREALLDRMGQQGLRDARSVYLRSAHLANVGRLREAIDVARQASELDPVDPATTNWLGLCLYAGGRYADARHYFEQTLARWPDSHYAAINLIMVCVQIQDWEAIDALLAPERLAKFPLRENEPAVRGFVSVLRNPSPSSQLRPVQAARRRLESTGYADLLELQLAAEMGNVDEAHAIAASARFGPAGNARDQMGSDAYRPGVLFYARSPCLRQDRRFVELCARLGLVEYWLTTERWPDCVDEVAGYYDFKMECARIATGPPLPPANDTGWLG